MLGRMPVASGGRSSSGTTTRTISARSATTTSTPGRPAAAHHSRSWGRKASKRSSRASTGRSPSMPPTAPSTAANSCRPNSACSRPAPSSPDSSTTRAACASARSPWTTPPWPRFRLSLRLPGPVSRRQRRHCRRAVAGTGRGGRRPAPHRRAGGTPRPGPGPCQRAGESSRRADPERRPRLPRPHGRTRRSRRTRGVR